MKIGDEIFVHGYVDEIRQGVVIIRNEGGYFGTVEDEIRNAPSVAPKRTNVECYARNCEKNKNGRCEATDIILEFGCGC